MTWKVPPPPGVMVQGYTGIACGTSGICGTATASSLGEPKPTASVDDTICPTLAKNIKSQEDLRKDTARARAKYLYRIISEKTYYHL
ncbi:hypothetical protein ABG067_005784 [Albugo candida]